MLTTPRPERQAESEKTTHSAHRWDPRLNARGGATPTDVQVQDHRPENFKLKGGQIFTGGVFDMASEGNFWTIMGGTGKYKGVPREPDAATSTADIFDEISRFEDQDAAEYAVRQM